MAISYATLDALQIRARGAEGVVVLEVRADMGEEVYWVARKTERPVMAGFG